MSSPSDFKLFVFTASEPNPAETSFLDSFLEHGAAAVYLRKQEYTSVQLLDVFNTIKPEWHDKLMIPLTAFPLLHAGVTPLMHVREHEKKMFTGKETDKASGHTTSIHDISEWGPNLNSFQYVFYSPVFASISKPAYAPTQPLSVISRQIKVQRAASVAPLPQLIALGGIDENNICEVKSAGFDGAALMGAIWQPKNPLDAFLRIRSKIS